MKFDEHFNKQLNEAMGGSEYHKARKEEAESPSTPQEDKEMESYNVGVRLNLVLEMSLYSEDGKDIDEKMVLKHLTPEMVLAAFQNCKQEMDITELVEIEHSFDQDKYSCP